MRVITVAQVREADANSQVGLKSEGIDLYCSLVTL